MHWGTGKRRVMMDSPRPALDAALRRLDGLVNWERRSRAGMDAGLASIQDLLRRLGNPQRRYRSVHVTGTKGKGSVSALVEAAVAEAGIAAGRYSTPYLWHPSEQITLAGVPVADDIFAAAIDAAMEHVDRARDASAPAGNATYFDVMTAAAYAIFAQANVEWAVVEVGMGGRLDSTNVIDAEVAVLTNVDLEHMEALGSTREAIALNKAGIVKPGATLVTGLAADDPAGRVAADYAASVKAEVVTMPTDSHSSIADRNAALAGAVLDQLGRLGVCARAPDPGRAVGAWLLSGEVRSRARLPVRLERIGLRTGAAARSTPVVLDGAHVASSLRAVLAELERDGLTGRTCTALVGLAADKDAEAFLAVLRDAGAGAVVTTAPSATRPYGAEELARIAGRLGLATTLEPEVGAAFAAALKEAAATGGWVLATGSLHLAAAVRTSCYAQGGVVEA
jgi:dihydrofolate synthase / folylpolyglutamate synthase